MIPPTEDARKREKEEDTSPYKQPRVSFPSGEFPKELWLRRRYFTQYESTLPDLGNIKQKVLPALYQALDRLSGAKSYLVLPKQTSVISLYQGILDFLGSQGILKGVASPERFNDAPRFFRFSLAPSFPPGITDGGTGCDPSGHGFGRDEETALSKAIGEFLERYFLTLYKKKDLTRGSLRSMREKGIIDLASFSGFSDEQKAQYPERQYGEDSVFYWEKAIRVKDGKNRFVPAQFVYWNYKREKDEPLLAETNTNGAGGFFSKEGAILSGLYELIHRDAFLIYWLNALSPQKIVPESVPDNAFQEMLEESKKYHFTVHCLNIASDIGVPSVAVVLEDGTGRHPLFSVGAGCEADPAKALRRALEEAWAVYYWMRPQPIHTLPETYDPFRDRSVGHITRVRLWSNPEMAKQFAFFLSGNAVAFSDILFDYPKQFPSEEKELQSLVAKVEKLGPGYEVYCHTVEHPTLSTLGFFVAKIIVPQLVPLYLGEPMAPLGAARLREVPQKLGYTPAKKPNPLPHPFP